ncbi:MAG: T9SS type A sorting domain-containing protein [Bacteroidales bacterium]
MKKLLFVTILLALFAVKAQSQISKPATPPGFLLDEDRATIPIITLSEIDKEKLIAEDAVFDTMPGIPWRFGDNIEVDLSPENSGVWKKLKNGDKLWQLGISSSGALSLNLTFNKYKLPENAQLFIYNTDRSDVLGAFTELNNQDDGYFATTLVKGDNIIIEYLEPGNAEFPGELNISTVTHAYRSPYDYVKGFGHSGSCNLNVACPEADDWQDQVNSAVLLLTGSNAFCSGSIINNVREDFSPYLLTANHCYKTPSTVVVWFNWQSEYCDNPSSSPSYDSMSGAVSIARNPDTDFWLMELNQAIPEDYNPFFAGWNRTIESILDETIIAVHHPKGDIKKFSYALDGVETSAYLGYPGSGSTHWRIVWSGGTTTEPGSSGSPLFDSGGKIIGQLHGGYAACNNSHPDWYGKFGMSWTGGGTDNTRLKTWLDPDNLDLPELPGIYYSSYEVHDPSRFKATALSDSKILLSWGLNSKGENIIVAYNSNDEFGKPEDAYTLGEELEGGGTILYIGHEENFIHENLDYNSNYYYKAWSFDNNLNYSAGVSANAVTFCYNISELPYIEEFNDDEIINCWEQEVITGHAFWQAAYGNNNNSPDSPYSGNYNLLFKSENPGNSTRIILPDISFDNKDNGRLSFYYTNSANKNQDTLRVYTKAYKNSEWELKETFASNKSDWTYADIILPEISKKFQIAFEATANGSEGICIDSIKIEGYYDADFASPTNLILINTDSHTAHLSWKEPASSENTPEVQYYKIYRNGTFTGGTTTRTEIVDTGIPVGNHEYSVSAVYINPEGESELSEAVDVNILSIDPVQVDIEIEGNGSTSLPAGNYTYNYGTFITITATPGENWDFSHYEVNSEILSEFPTEKMHILEDIVLKAVFTESEYLLDITSNPEGTGNQTGSGYYYNGDIANISTSTPEGYFFLYWEDENKILSTNPEFNLQITENTNLTANFLLKKHTIQVFANPMEGGTVSGGGYMDYGTEITVSAEANEGWSFIHWKDNGEIVSADKNYMFNVDKDHTLIAVFQLGNYYDMPGDKQEKIALYPNPATDIVNLKLSNMQGKAVIELFSINGQKVFSEEININNTNQYDFNINLNKLQQGIYILNVSNNNTFFIEKLIVN